MCSTDIKGYMKAIQKKLAETNPDRRAAENVLLLDMMAHTHLFITFRRGEVPEGRDRLCQEDSRELQGLRVPCRREHEPGRSSNDVAEL